MLKINDWLNVLVEKAGCSKEESRALFDSVFEEIKNGLKENDVVKIAGFGTFKTKDVPEQEKVNPQTQEKVIVPAHTVISFKPSFEVEPKPESIELSDEEYEKLTGNPAPAKENTTEVVEEPVKEEVKAEPVKEEPVKEKVVEAQPVKEVAQPAANPNEIVIHTDWDRLIWVFKGKEFSTEGMKAKLFAVSSLSEDDVTTAMDHVIARMDSKRKNTCYVTFKRKTLDFTLKK